MTDDDTDAEPTTAAASDGDTAAAPNEDATELLDTSAAPTPDLAWSTETEDLNAPTERYTWRGTWLRAALVIVCAVMLAGGIGAAFWVWTQHRGHAAPLPPVAAHPAPVPPDPDARFIELYEQRGYRPSDPAQQQQMINAAHNICARLEAGESKDDAAREFMRDNPDAKPGAGKLLVSTVIDAYHPAISNDPDKRFLALVQQRGAVVVSPPAAIRGAHETCELEAEGHSARDIAQAFVNVTPGRI